MTSFVNRGLWAAAAAFLLSPICPLLASDDVSPVGAWRWFNRVKVTINADGSTADNKGQRGMWEWIDQPERQFRIIWSHVTDTLRLSPDGAQLAGRSSDNGIAVTGQRLDEERARLFDRVPSTEATFVPSEFLGTWNIAYDNEHARTYVITPSGIVYWTHTYGNPERNRKTKLLRRDKDFLIDFGEDRIERVSSSNGGLLIEHYNPKGAYRYQEEPLLGRGSKVRK